MKSRSILFTLLMILSLGLVSANPVAVNPFGFFGHLSSLMALVLAVIITIVIEFVVYLIGVRKINAGKLFLYSVLINLFTVPLVNFLFKVIMEKTRYASSQFLFFILIEVGVILVESLLLFLLTRKAYWKVLIISLIANILTAMIGLLVFMF